MGQTVRIVFQRLRKLSSVSEFIQTVKAVFWRLLKKAGAVPSDDSLEDQSRDRIAHFDEHPSCAICSGQSVAEKLIAKDGNRIVECTECGLWFTSPRISESTWTDYLKSTTERSREFTENRLRYGVALSSNVKYTLPDWYENRIAKENVIIDQVEKHLGKKVESLHDVGCGVGYLLSAAQERGIEASGNDLNAYACQVMREKQGLTVFNDSLTDLDLSLESLDAVIMHDYIEHTYHPLEDLRTAHGFLSPGGIVHITTFHVDCRTFDRLGKDWNMLFWNHTYHFSTKTLSKMVTEAGFTDLDVTTSYETDLIAMTARKPLAPVKTT